MRDVVEIGKTFEKLSRLDKILHEHESVGGVLHIITDDGNVEDHHVVGCYRDAWAETSQPTTFVGVVCCDLLHLLLLLTEPQRVVWRLSASLGKEGIDPAVLAASVRDGGVRYGENRGLYDARVVSADGETVLWEGFLQYQARRNREHGQQET
jgi:hypothetical protein